MPCRTGTGITALRIKRRQVSQNVPAQISGPGHTTMLKPRKRTGGPTGSTNGTWRIFDTRQLSWIALAITGLVLFAYMTG